MVTTVEDQLRACMKHPDDAEKLAALNAVLGTGQSSPKQAIVSMADSGLVPGDLLMELMSNQDLFGYAPRAIQTILITLANFHYGGGPRSICSLANALSQVRDENGQARFRILLVSDEPPSSKDYYLAPALERITVPARNAQASYADRADALYNLIEEKAVDLVIQGTRRDGDSLWDMLLCKSHPARPAYIQIFHTCFGSLLLSASNDQLLRRKHLYSYADALVVLSKVDWTIWSTYNPHVFCIPNIVHTPPHPDRVFSGKHRVLWAGRISSQKQAMELVEVARVATGLLPDIHFDVIGESSNAGLFRALEDSIDSHGLKSNVSLCGNQVDVDRQYASADVLCHTAMYEGMGLVLYEAAAHALPVVMYKIRGIDYKEHLGAIIECEQWDSEGMAREIVDLLTDPGKYAAASGAIAAQYSAYQKRDLVSEWLKVFTYLENGKTPVHEPASQGDVAAAIDNLVFYRFAYPEYSRRMKAALEGGSASSTGKRIPAKVVRMLKRVANAALSHARH